MGLIKAGLGALGGTFADQWKEFFYCDALANDVLATRGKKQISGRSSNTKGNDNIISNGSGIAVADGQCMMIVEQGKVVELCAEPGEYTYDKSTEPSIFSGSLGSSIINTFKTIGKRFAYGGDTGKDQRVYYFNIKEIMDNKFGTPNPIPFRVVDKNIGLDIDVSVRCSGIYSYKITDPMLFYTNICGNVQEEYKRSEIDQQLKQEFISALHPSLGELSSLGIRPNQLPGHNVQLSDALKTSLAEKWQNFRGITVWSVALSSVTLPDEDAELIKNAQRTAIMRDPTMAAATLVGAQADAMKAAASNEAGAMTGFMGMGMAMNSGGMNAQNLFEIGKANAAANAAVNTPASATTNGASANGWKCSCGAVNTGNFCSSCGGKKPEEGWKCNCGAVNQGKFCTECGATKPEDGWTCSCGAVNKGKFCAQCGSKKPAGEPLYRCDKCGWEPEDPKNPPKFCPECGDLFDDKDAK